MSLLWQRVSDQLREIGAVALGLILAATPLAIWIAWSDTVFIAILAICVGAMVSLIALVWFDKSDDAHRPAEERSNQGDSLDPEFIVELHRLVPFTYHHRRLGDVRIRRKMAKLRALRRIPED
jgi:hypothetical protein